MRPLLLTLALTLLILAPWSAWAEDCTSSASGTWTGDAGDGGTVTWTGCTPTADDTYTIAAAHTVEITGRLGTSGTPMSGAVTVNGTIDLDADAVTSIYASGDWTFSSGSDGTWQGYELDPFSVPVDVTFPSATTIQFDYSGIMDPDADGNDIALPWVICDSATLDCDETTIHQEDTDSGQEKPATSIYFPFPGSSPYGQSVRIAGGAAEERGRIHDNAGRFFEVSAVSDCTTGTNCTAFTVTLPRTGPDNGSWHFGADGNAASITVGTGETVRGTAALQWTDECAGWTGGDTNDRASDAFTADGAAEDTSGCRLRNGLSSEGDYTVTGVAVNVNSRGQPRYEIRVQPGAISDDHELQGMLACVGNSTSDLNTERWCARITRTVDDWNGATAGTDDAFVVWRDPHGAVKSGDELSVYYARPFPGDTIIPVNQHLFDGGRAASFLADEGTSWGITTAATGLKWQRMNHGSWRHRVPSNFTSDLWWIQHFGGTSAIPGISIKALEFGTQGNAAGPYDVENLTITRFYGAWPNWSMSDTTSFGMESFIGLTAENAALSGPNPDSWTGTKVRDIRADGTEGLLYMQAGVYTACPDGLIAQNLLKAHGHLSRGNVEHSPGLEDLEFQGASDDCDVHNVAINSGTRGNYVVARQNDNGSYAWRTRLISMVGSGVNDSNDDGTGPSVMVSDSGVEIAETFIVGNYLTDGAVGSRLSHHYGAYIGWFQHQQGTSNYGHTVGGVASCGDSIGMFMIGTERGAQGFECEHSELGRVPADARWLDYVSLNTYASGAFSYFWLPDGSNGELPSRSMTWKRILLHYSSNTSTPRLAGLQSWNTPLNATPSWEINDIVHIVEGSAGTLSLRADGTTFYDRLSLGPNIYAITKVGTQGFRCQNSGDGIFTETLGEACELQASIDPSGVAGGTSGIHQAKQGGNPIPGMIDGSDFTDPAAAILSLHEWTGTWEDSCTQEGGSEACSLVDALPQWSGPYAYEWPYAWHTVDPVPGFRRTEPMKALIPAYVKDAAGMGGGADGGGSFAPTPFGRQ